MADNHSQYQSDNQDRPRRWWDLLSALLLIAALEAAATRLVTTHWSENLSVVQNVAFWATLAGLALGKSAFRRWVAGLFALLYGSFVIPWQLGMLLGEGIKWEERLLSILGRVRAIAEDILVRRPVLDNMLFLTAMAFLFWIICIYSGFELVRSGNVWRALIPPGLAAFVIQSFDNVLNERALSLTVYLFLSLVIIARMHFLHMRRKWEVERTHIPPDVDWDLGRFGMIVSLVLVLVAWNFPTLSSAVSGFSDLYQMVNRPWMEFKDRMSYIFQSLRSTAGMAPVYYGDEHGLGRGIPLSDALIFQVEVPPYPSSGANYYWRARTYDFYEDRLWSSNLRATQDFSPQENEYFGAEESPGRVLIHADFTPNSPTKTLYTPAQPVWVSRPAELQIGRNPDDSIDLVSVNADPALRRGEVYEVRALIPTVTQLQLREAGTEYPDWVLDRYLQLPENLPPRIRQLAEEIAQPYDNLFDQADAITNWLRANIEYVDTIDVPPNDQEVIDWFLFDYRKGFCNYYATAEVVLLRSLGIPARWAVGYALGEPLPAQQQPTLPPGDESIPPAFLPRSIIYAVRQHNAHAWPEVYFPGIGWVEFEPTVSITAITRPSGIINESNLDEEGRTPERDLPIPDEESLDIPQSNRDAIALDERARRTQALLSLGFVLGVIVLVILVSQVRRSNSRLNRWWRRVRQGERLPFPVRLERGVRKIGISPPEFLRWWANYSLLPLMSRAYLEINRALTRLGRPPAISETPAERGDALVALLPEATRPTHRLLTEYQAAIYSTRPANAWTARLMAEDIRRLSRRARIKKVFADWKDALIHRFVR